MSKDISTMSQEEKEALARKAKAAYRREYRKKNPEAERERELNYWARKGLELEEAEKHD